MTTTSEVELFQALKSRLGENEAETMVGYLKGEVKHQFNSRKEIYATKEDLGMLQSGIMKEIYATKEDIGKLRSGIMKEIYATRADMGKLRSDIMKSIYSAGLVQLLVILSSLLAIVTFLS